MTILQNLLLIVSFVVIAAGLLSMVRAMNHVRRMRQS